MSRSLANRSLALVSLGVAVGLLVACGSDPDAATAPQSDSQPAEMYNPADLIGRWTVTQASGAFPQGSIVDFAPNHSMAVYDPAGAYSERGWVASSTGTLKVGLVQVGSIDESVSNDGSDPNGNLPTMIYALIDDELVLSTTDGEVVARLVAGGDPLETEHVIVHEAPTRDNWPSSQPTASHGLQEAGLRAPDASQLIGRWVPTVPDTPDTRAYVDFASDSTWRGSDGCNGTAGIWILDEHGWWATPSGVMTAMGCENSPIDQWIADSVSIGIDTDGDLVLIDASNTELGRLHRTE